VGKPKSGTLNSSRRTGELEGQRGDLENSAIREHSLGFAPLMELSMQNEAPTWVLGEVTRVFNDGYVYVFCETLREKFIISMLESHPITRCRSPRELGFVEGTPVTLRIVKKDDGSNKVDLICLRHKPSFLANLLLKFGPL
jgi:hypothetical protein